MTIIETIHAFFESYIDQWLGLAKEKKYNKILKVKQ
jgi:hypothetical protein